MDPIDLMAARTDSVVTKPSFIAGAHGNIASEPLHVMGPSDQEGLQDDSGGVDHSSAMHSTVGSEKLASTSQQASNGGGGQQMVGMASLEKNGEDPGTAESPDDSDKMTKTHDDADDMVFDRATKETSNIRKTQSKKKVAKGAKGKNKANGKSVDKFTAGDGHTSNGG